MKFLKVKNLSLALLIVLFWSCSENDMITESESVIDQSVIDQTAEGYDYTQEPDLVITEEELARLEEEFNLDFSQDSGNQDITSRNWRLIPNWAWWIYNWENSGGHMLERHWSKGQAYLLSRPIAQATTFDPGAIAPHHFANMMKYIYDTYSPYVKDIAPGQTVGLSFSHGPGWNKILGWGYYNAGGTKTVFATKKFTVVFKKVAATGTIIILTAFPVL